MQLFVRLFANCESAEAAAGISQRIALALSRVGGQQASTPKPYWKLPYLYEFTYTLRPASHETFQEVLSFSHGGWHHSPGEIEFSSVWNRAGDRVFLIPEVSWAEVQLHESVA
jgi:hypothetical protein